jgi:hypothetical protein
MKIVTQSFSHIFKVCARKTKNPENPFGFARNGRVSEKGIPRRIMVCLNYEIRGKKKESRAKVCYTAILNLKKSAIS